MGLWALQKSLRTKFRAVVRALALLKWKTMRRRRQRLRRCMIPKSWAERLSSMNPSPNSREALAAASKREVSAVAEAVAEGVTKKGALTVETKMVVVSTEAINNLSPINTLKSFPLCREGFFLLPWSP